MEFAVAIGLGGWALLIVGALVIGVAGQFMGRAHTTYEWIATAIGAFVAGLVASEFVVALRTFEPVWDGLALAPALIAGIVVGAVVAVAARFVVSDTYDQRPMSA
jgi:hypothetical protein